MRYGESMTRGAWMNRYELEEGVKELQERQECSACQQKGVPVIIAYARTAREKYGTLKGFCSQKCYTRFLEDLTR